MEKTAIITGASGGIGAAVARILAPEYAVVAGYFKNEDAAAALERALIADGYDAAICRADITDPRQTGALAEFALKRYGGIDLLVNCAGQALFALVCDTTDAQYERTMAVNMAGVFYSCRAVLPHMTARKQGCIINITSMWGQTGASCEAVYSASKAAVIGFSKALAKEVGPCGIAVNCVAPGLIETDMNKTLTKQELDAFAGDTPLGRIGSPLDVARAVQYLAADRFTTGQVLCPNGGAVI